MNMDRKKVVIDFDANGKATVSAHGYTGQTCLAATAPFEQMFKQQVGERQFVGDDCAPAPGELVRR